MASESKSTGIGLPTLLFVVFLILKLTGTVAWSWWWVTSPLWIPAALAIVVIGIVLLVSLIVTKGK